MPKKEIAVELAMGEGFKMEGTIGGHTLYVDQPEAMGGTDAGPNPLQYSLLSLGGCIGAVSRIIANQEKLDIRSIKVSVQGELDTDVLLGKSQDGRPGFGGVEVSVELDADMSDEEKEAFIAKVDSRCPISDNLLSATPVRVALKK
jgi:uncharacterized OsmC-like protein